MLNRSLHSSTTVLFTLLSTVVFTSSQALAQPAPTSELSPNPEAMPSDAGIASGFYSRGIQQIQIAQSDGNICIYGFVDSEVEAQQTEAFERLRQESAEAEAQFQTQLQQDLSSRREEIRTLLQNESQLAAAIETRQLSPEQVQQIERFRDNPQELDGFLQQQVDEATQQLAVRLEEKRLEAEETVRAAAGNMVIQGVASLDLAYSDINAYTVSGTNFILFAQEEGRLVFGESDKLQEFNPGEAGALADSSALQECLDSQQPYSQLTLLAPPSP